MKRLGLAIVLTAMALAPVSSVHADKAFTVGDIKGRYAFSFQGEIVGVAPTAATGMLVADGRGEITYAIRSINIGGVPVSETFSCTLTVNEDGTGSAECPLDDPAPGAPPVETFDFVLEDKGKAFRFVGTTPGIVVLGSGARQ